MPVLINITMYNTGTSNQKGISQPSSLCARLVCWGHHVQSRVQGYAMCALIMPLSGSHHNSRVLVVWMRCQISISTANIPCEVCCRCAQHQKQSAVVHAGPQLSKQQAARHASITAPPSCTASSTPTCILLSVVPPDCCCRILLG